MSVNLPDYSTGTQNYSMSGVQEPTQQGKIFVWQYLEFLTVFLIATMVFNLLHSDSAPKRGPTLDIL